MLARTCCQFPFAVDKMQRTSIHSPTTNQVQMLTYKSMRTAPWHHPMANMIRSTLESTLESTQESTLDSSDTTQSQTWSGAPWTAPSTAFVCNQQRTWLAPPPPPNTPPPHIIHATSPTRQHHFLFAIIVIVYVEEMQYLHVPEGTCHLKQLLFRL